MPKTRRPKLTTWLQKRESDTESLVTDDVEIRVEGEENTHDVARQSEQNATIDNSSNCEETDEIAETDEICIDDLGLWPMIVTIARCRSRPYCQ